MAVELIAFHLKRIKTGKKSHDSKRWKSVNTSKPGAHTVRGGREGNSLAYIPVYAVQELYTHHSTSSSWQAL